MSGRKCSKFELESTRNLVLENRVKANQLLQDVGVLEKVSEDLNYERDIIEKLKNSEEAYTNAKEELKRLQAFSEADLLKKSIDELDSLNTKYIELSETIKRRIDILMGGGELTHLRNIEQQFSYNNEDYNNWIGESFEHKRKDTESQLISLNEEFKSGKLCDESLLKAKKIQDDFEVLNNTVLENKTLHSKRLHFTAALQEICDKKGWGLTVNEQKRPIDELSLEIDTYAYGKWIFSLNLDGFVNSNEVNLQKELEEVKKGGKCVEIHRDIDKELDKFGITSNFTYFDGSSIISENNNSFEICDFNEKRSSSSNSNS
jgi:hypothetical protein